MKMRSFLSFCRTPGSVRTPLDTFTFKNMDEQKLKEEKKRLEHELKELCASKTESEYNAEYIQLVHEYNTVKDAVQTLIGGLANLQNVTLKEIHERLNLPVDD